MDKNAVFENLKVLVVEDDVLLRRALYDSLIGWGCGVLAADTLMDARRLLEAELFHVMICDMCLPDGDGLDLVKEQREANPKMAVAVMTAYADVKTAVKAIKYGAVDYLSKPFEDAQLFAVLRAIEERRRMSVEAIPPPEESISDFDGLVWFDQMIGTAAMADIFKMAKRVAKCDTTVLLLGESGSGKGMLSKAIHRSSTRAQMPFVEVNCSAIPEHLLESELFGYEKGAFTDAKTKKIGLFEAAEGGTIFLDEIGDMSLALQAKILKILEDRSFRRLGALKSTAVDVRVVAATNHDLKKLAAEGQFREDLYYRLSVVPITVPPLRAHKASIEPLARYFLRLLSMKMKLQISDFEPKALQSMMAYSWPGNVRELRNVIERGLILSSGPVVEAMAMGLSLITSHDVPEGPAESMAELDAPLVSAPVAGTDDSDCQTLEEVERQHIVKVLEEVGGNRSKAAEVLRIHRTTLYKKLEAYQIV
jgi:DNA-binding NtrC family response regulator